MKPKPDKYANMTQSRPKQPTEHLQWMGLKLPKKRKEYIATQKNAANRRY